MAQQSAEQEAAKIVADAERLAIHFKTEAQRVAAAEVDKARKTLRAEIVEAVRHGVAQKLRAELNQDAQLKLVRNKISELNSIKATTRS